MSKTKHTATPWEVKGNYIHQQNPPKLSDWLVHVKEPFSSQGGSGEANAEFIVKACNSHEMLVDIINRFIVDSQLTGLDKTGGWDSLVIEAQQALKQVEEI